MNVDLTTVLQKIKKKSNEWTEERVLDAFRGLLDQDERMEERLKSALQNAPEGSLPNIDSSQLDDSKIYHVSHIQQLATNYRLRFLDAHLFKGEIPAEAMSKLKSIQRRQPEDLSHFKIMAPASLFELGYKDKDPLLFMPLGKNLYYLVHKWGKDMHPLRKLMVYPFRNIGTLIKSMFLFAFLFQLAIPTDIINGGYEGQSLTIRIWMTLHVFIAMAGIMAMVGYPYLKNFNSVLWNSKYKD